MKSPRVGDVERDIAALRDVVRRADLPSVDLTARTLAAAFDALDAGEADQVRSDVEVELLRARQLLNGERANRVACIRPT